MTNTNGHVPVLVSEVMRYFAPQPGDSLLDATVGLGGHAKAYLELTNPSGRVTGFDADARALKQAQQNLKAYGNRVTLHHANYYSLKDSTTGGGILPAPGESRHGRHQGFTHVLFDLGIGSHQLDDATRGFSFAQGRSLRMQYGEVSSLPSALVPSLNVLTKRLGFLPDVPDILAGLTAAQLAEVLRTYGEERYARRIAAAIKEAETLPTTAIELAALIRRAVPALYEHGRIHPATRTFQALRLAVNRELETLTTILPVATDLLAVGGKIAVISFHSLEDRIVKQFFRRASATCTCPPTQPICTCTRSPLLKILTKRPVRAGERERDHNPRARSAKLRVASRAGP
ncbi:MAG: 16S rRNA (cytosine(1402)-N(4))-methyltransferase RsmH [Candidatus Andersenbacteria bacterium]